MAKSKFIEEMVAGGDTDGREISGAQARFEAWLAKLGYVPAVDGAPYDSAEGGYMGTTDADELLGGYLHAHKADDRFCDELTKHAFELGPLWRDPEWDSYPHDHDYDGD
jgi:hypothetical protein